MRGQEDTTSAVSGCLYGEAEALQANSRSAAAWVGVHIKGHLKHSLIKRYRYKSISIFQKAMRTMSRRK